MNQRESTPTTSLFISVGASAFASAISETATFPVDCIKTNMQINNKGFVDSGMSLYRQNGMKRLYQGLHPAILRHWVYTNIRVGIYKPSIKYYSSWSNTNKTTEIDAKNANFGIKFLSGATAGGIGQFIANPTDLIKVQMQAMKTGQTPTYGSIIGRIYAQEGISGFYRGWKPNVQRAILVNAGELASYDITKQFLINKLHLSDTPLSWVIAGGISGLFSTFVSCPADVVKSKLMNDTSGIYKGVIDCYIKTIKNDGIRAIYRGFLPTWGRLGPWQLIFWTIKETTCKLCGIETM
jgi:solute carrier family 25 (mitochondrial uncoupling protein), member 27